MIHVGAPSASLFQLQEQLMPEPGCLGGRERERDVAISTRVGDILSHMALHTFFLKSLLGS